MYHFHLLMMVVQIIFDQLKKGKMVLNHKLMHNNLRKSDMDAMSENLILKKP